MGKRGGYFDFNPFKHDAVCFTLFINVMLFFFTKMLSDLILTVLLQGLTNSVLHTLNFLL